MTCYMLGLRGCPLYHQERSSAYLGVFDPFSLQPGIFTRVFPCTLCTRETQAIPTELPSHCFDTGVCLSSMVLHRPGQTLSSSSSSSLREQT